MRTRKRKNEKYRAYIRSDEWQQRKDAYYATHKRACAVCGRHANVILHHMHYRNVGHEPDEDLVPLCYRHHTEYHASVKVTTKRSTLRFIKEKKEGLMKKSMEKERKELRERMLAVEDEVAKKTGFLIGVVTERDRGEENTILHTDGYCRVNMVSPFEVVATIAAQLKLSADDLHEIADTINQSTIE